MAIRLSVFPEGKITLPPTVRSRLGVESGGTLIADEVENGLLLRSVAQVIEQAQAINRKYFASNTDASVDAFLSARRNDRGE